MWMQYPSIEELYAMDDQYFIGSDLLVKPITDQGASATKVTFPGADCWFDVDTMQKVSGSSDRKSSETLLVKIDIEKIPVYQRGGSILARKLRHRRSTQMMIKDPYTLYIALNESSDASGKVYMDDEHSFSYEGSDGNFGESEIFVKWGSFIKNRVSGNKDWISNNAATRMVERIVIMGVTNVPANMSMNSESIEFHFDPESQSVVIRNPNVSLLDEWDIQVSN